jgi:hypothetical protein
MLSSIPWEKQRQGVLKIMVKPVISGHFWDKEKRYFKTDSLLKEYGPSDFCDHGTYPVHLHFHVKEIIFRNSESEIEWQIYVK